MTRTVTLGYYDMTTHVVYTGPDGGSSPPSPTFHGALAFEQIYHERYEIQDSEPNPTLTYGSYQSPDPTTLEMRPICPMGPPYHRPSWGRY